MSQLKKVTEKISLVSIPCLKPGDAILLRLYGSDDVLVGIVKKVNLNNENKKRYMNVLTDKASEVFNNLMCPFFRPLTKTRFGTIEQGWTTKTTYRQVSHLSSTLANQYSIYFYLPEEDSAEKLFVECIERG